MEISCLVSTNKFCPCVANLVFTNNCVFFFTGSAPITVFVSCSTITVHR